MKIFFYGGRNAGMMVLLGVMAAGHEVVGVVPVDHPVENVANKLGIPVFKPKNINLPEIIDYIKEKKVDLFLCCHGRQILKENLLNLVPGINLHPLLFKYRGATPVARMIAAGEYKASVAAHWMTTEVDGGEVIVENFLEVSGNTDIEVYNELYWLYVTTCLEALEKKDIPLTKYLVKEGLNNDFNFCPATMEYAELLWQWRNDPTTRQNSFNHDVVERDEHFQWLQNIFFDTKRILWIVLNDKQTPVGQIRFDIKDNAQAEVSISIAPEWRGRNYGTRTMLLGTAKFFNTYKDINKILARVNKSNAASQKVFKRAGYEWKNEENGVVLYEFLRK